MEKRLIKKIELKQGGESEIIYDEPEGKKGKIKKIELKDGVSRAVYEQEKEKKEEKFEAEEVIIEVKKEEKEGKREKLKEMWETVKNKIKDAANPFFRGIKEMPFAIGAEIWAGSEIIADKLMEKGTQMEADIYNKSIEIKNISKDTKEIIEKEIKRKFNRFKRWFGDQGGAIKDGVENAKQWGRDKKEQAGNFILSTKDAFLNKHQRYIEPAVEGARTAGKWACDFLSPTAIQREQEKYLALKEKWDKMQQEKKLKEKLEKLENKKIALEQALVELRNPYKEEVAKFLTSRKTSFGWRK